MFCDWLKDIPNQEFLNENVESSSLHGAEMPELKGTGGQFAPLPVFDRSVTPIRTCGAD